MLWIVHRLWVYRNEILLAIQVISALRKTAREFAQEYIRKQMETRLKHAIVVVLFQVGILAGVFWLTQVNPGLASQILASFVLWVVTLFNLHQLLFVTVPELRALHRAMKGKLGYALKYFLEVSLVTELLRLNILFMFVCLGLGISTRTVVGQAFAYFEPWIRLSKLIGGT